MIICFSGRMGSGKTMLANTLVEREKFIRFAFADFLKETISKLYNISLDELYDPNLKNKILNIPLPWNKYIFNKLLELVKINEFHIEIIDMTFNTYREAMQYIGTDILRKYDNNFHIKATLSRLDLNKSYVCDDVRYPNELEALKKMGAYCFYILRPNNFNISNHKSEVALNWTQFEYHILNDKKASKIIKHLMDGLPYLNKKIKIKKQIDFKLTKNKLFKKLNKYNFDTKLVAQDIDCSTDKIVWWAHRLFIHIHRNNYSYDHEAFLHPTPAAAYYAGLISADGCIKKSGVSETSYVVDLTSQDLELIAGFRKFIKTNKPIYSRIHKINGKPQYYLIINSPYIIENIKYWNLKPRKSRYNEIPDIIKDNDLLMNFWLLGLIDGDGSVFLRGKNQNNFAISVLSSKEIAEYILSKYANTNPHIEYNHKGVENLCQVRWNGKFAVQLYNIIYHPMALQRKWAKVKPFLTKKWIW